MMRGQRGSILVVVLSLSIIMTAAAAAYLALGTNAGGASADSQRISRTYLAAESGLVLGVRWCKYYTAGNFLVDTWMDSLILTQSSVPGVEGWADFDGVQVKVVFKHGTGGGHHELNSYATAGPGLGMVKLSMQINGGVAIVGAPPGAPVTTFDGGYVSIWIDSLFPGR